MSLKNPSNFCDMSFSLTNGGTANYYCVLHKENGPAITRPGGEEWWYKNGILHRENGPAVIIPNRAKYWYRNGVYHREDGPAIEYHNGTVEYYVYGSRQ